MEIVFLGTGAGSGVPVFYCGCKACNEARCDSCFRRTRSAILLTGKKDILIDAPPELSSQLLSAGIDKIDYLLLTHWHYDHIGGLGEIESYVRLHNKKPLPALMSRETWEQVKAINYLSDDYLKVRLIEPGQISKIGEVFITALEATHTPGTLGFLIENDGIFTAYFPDTGPFYEKTKEKLYGIDRLILDATFWGKNWYPQDHLSFDQAIDIGKELKTRKLYLTHLSMHYDTPVTSKELEDKLKSHKGKVGLAYDGLRISL